MSIVIQAAIEAFQKSLDNSGDQITLRTLRNLQEVLFQDVFTTLNAVEQAPEIFVTKESGSVGKSFRLDKTSLNAWIEKFPNGVAWPITVALKTCEGLLPAPMRILIMVPLHSNSKNLYVPRGLFAHMYPKFENESGVAQHSAIFLGLQCEENGNWEYGAAAGLLYPSTENVLAYAMPIVPDFVKAKSNHDEIDFEAATELLLKQSISDEIGFVLLQGHTH